MNGAICVGKGAGHKDVSFWHGGYYRLMEWVRLRVKAIVAGRPA